MYNSHQTDGTTSGDRRANADILITGESPERRALKPHFVLCTSESIVINVLRLQA